MIWCGLANSNPIHKVLTAIRFRLAHSLLDIVPATAIKSHASLLASISSDLDLFPNSAKDLLPLLIEACCICWQFPNCISCPLQQRIGKELQPRRGITRRSNKRLTKSQPTENEISHWSGLFHGKSWSWFQIAADQLYRNIALICLYLQYGVWYYLFGKNGPGWRIFNFKTAPTVT